MTDIKAGNVRRQVELYQTYWQRFGEGLVATDGVVYSDSTSFGTGAATVVNKLIDPGIDLQLSEIQVGLTQKFINAQNAVGSITYYWSMFQESVATTRSAVNITGTYTKGIGSLASSEDTFSGYISVGSVPQAPVRVQLVAVGLVASSMTAYVKNSSFIKLVGAIIPGA